MTIILPNLDEMQPWLKADEAAMPNLLLTEPPDHESLPSLIDSGDDTGESLDRRLHPIKGGPGSGFHGHSGRPGQRGGSDSDDGPAGSSGTAVPTVRSPIPSLSGRPVTRTQAIAVALQKLDGGERTGNLLTSDAGKHFFALGFKGPTINRLYRLSQMYKSGGESRQKAIGAIMTALASDTELGDALRAQIDTEDALARSIASRRPTAKTGKIPTSQPQSGRGQGSGTEDRTAADQARAQREHAKELAGQIAEEKRKKAKSAERWRGQIGETVHLGTIVDAVNHGDTVMIDDEPHSWPHVVSNYHVLAGLGISYAPSSLTLLRRDALPQSGLAQKGIDDRIINLDDSDANADWIKLVNPRSTEMDRAIHKELAKQSVPSADTDDEAWPDVGSGTDAAEA
ncbi:MAG TPA: hypothetical protein PKH77_17795 [Anaerolineae bacterium]|nr:hypothetical protein [Anaerolineae bacterium]